MTLKSGLSRQQLEDLRRLSERLREQPPVGPAAPQTCEADEADEAGEADAPAPGCGPAPDRALAAAPDRPDAPEPPGTTGAAPADLGPVRTAPVGTPVLKEVELGRMPALPSFVVVCWSCGESFPLNTLAGTRSLRRCPLCGAELREARYDLAAATVLADPALSAYHWARDEHARIQELRRQNHQRRLGLRTLVERFGLWRRSRRSSRRLDAASPAGLACEQRLFALARARYFTGRWYLDTRAPLWETPQGQVSGYRLVADYAPDGAFVLRDDRLGQDASGMMGEFLVFECARRALEPARGVLEGAAVVPNLFLPLGSGGDRSLGMRWRQVDLVVVTTRAVLVCEVKSLSFDLRASADYTSLERRRPRGGWVAYDRPVRQVTGAAFAIRDILPTVPRNRFYRAVLLSGSGNLTGGDGVYRDGLLVDSVRHHQARFLKLLSQATAGLEPFTTPSGVADIARTLERYGDPTRQKLATHVQDIAQANRQKRDRRH